LLYGLLLPSGNDAAVALAEHCGSLCEPVESAPNATSEARFIAEMNRQAKSLSLADTHFANPHGLPADRHRSSARDLVKLTTAACRHPLFVEVIRTRQHGCKLESAGGKRRNVVWKNTNRLLEREGWLGAKTGTTNAAGACLVAIGERNGERLIVVVLGATHNDARYTDTRNLYRWACQQCQQK
jgi:D-alanyl-D-alanine carboxypeptidase (penicillin-binding protein 5/6)